MDVVGGGQSILVFDGDCGSCTTAAHWVQRRWPTGRADAEPWQRIDARRLADLGLDAASVATQVWWVDGSGARGGAAAISAALVAAGGGWAQVGRAVGAPALQRPAAALYRLVARHRHRLPGGTPACRR
jgi:predicted DCC family thiol-disulfide oxidoreductase YuxK